MTTTYTAHGPLGGFRGELTRACLKAIIRNDSECPTCGQPCPTGPERLDHATSGVCDLRADVAGRL